MKVIVLEHPHHREDICRYDAHQQVVGVGMCVNAGHRLLLQKLGPEGDAASTHVRMVPNA